MLLQNLILLAPISFTLAFDIKPWGDTRRIRLRTLFT